MLEKLHAFFNPEEFRGRGKKRNYFEGWYFKLVSADENTALAIIPGIAINAEGEGMRLYGSGWKSRSFPIINSAERICSG